MTALRRPGSRTHPSGTDIGTPGRGVVRSRAVVVNLDAFPSATATAPATVALPLFEDAHVEARLDPALTNETHRSWRGAVAGGGDVVLVERNGYIAGSVTSPQGRFRLRAIEGGLSVVEEIDPQSFPEAHEHPLPPQETATATTDTGAVRLRAGVSTGTQAHDHNDHDHGAAPVTVSTAGLPGSGDQPVGAGLLAAPALVLAADGEVITIDVLVAYSTAAKTRMGGTGPVEADIALAVEQTNTAFATSDVAARLRLVGSPEVPTNGNVTGAVLDSVRNPGNGEYDNLHTLRDALGADLVALIVDDTANQYCGIAYQMGPNGNTPSFASAAFSVTDAQCSTGALTFPHELGHNFGAAHDRGAWSGTPVYPYGYGWVNAAAHWRDVMSYANACSGCTRLLRYSNPDQTYNGAPIGSPIGTPLQADNRAVFNTTAGVVASFRGTPVPTSLTVLEPVGGASVAVPGALTVRWNASGAIGGSVKVELLRASSVVAVLAPAAATGVGAVTWKAPATLPRGTDYTVRVTSVANPAATTTSDPFSITDPTITLTSAQGESWTVASAHPVTWTYTGTPTGGVKLELLRAERVVATIAGGAPLGSNGQGTYAWTPPATLGAYTDYRVRATLASLPTVRDSTDQDLELTGGPRLSLTAPTAGATWAAGSIADRLLDGERFPRQDRQGRVAARRHRGRDGLRSRHGDQCDAQAPARPAQRGRLLRPGRRSRLGVPAGRRRSADRRRGRVDPHQRRARHLGRRRRPDHHLGHHRHAGHRAEGGARAPHRPPADPGGLHPAGAWFGDRAAAGEHRHKPDLPPAPDGGRQRAAHGDG